MTPYNSNLPFGYWIPKFHKVPTGFRFITARRNTYINGVYKYSVLGLNVF